MVEQEKNICVVLDDDISSSLLGHFEENIALGDEDDGDDEGQDSPFWPLQTFCLAIVMVLITITIIILVFGTLVLVFYFFEPLFAVHTT